MLTRDLNQDPEAEYAAWKLRELKRIKREREAIEAREAERAEVERRRNLTEEERRAEDAAFLARQRAEREGRGPMAYLQKYHHRGAFYRGDAEAEALAARDIMGARFADDVRNRELLPKALQLRDMTRLGRKGASKYRDLRSEDTGRWGDHLRRDDRPGRGAASSSDFNSRRVDDRFRSDRERDRDADGPGGANAIPLGERKAGADRGGDRYRDRDRDRDYHGERNSYRPRGDGDRDRRDDGDDDRRRGRDRSRSRSRSPRRRHDDHYGGGGGRKRDSSRDAGRYRDADKRRRIDAAR